MSLLRHWGLFIAAAVFITGCDQKSPPSSEGTQRTDSNADAIKSEPTVELSREQLNAVKIEPVGLYKFSIDKEGLGSIVFDNKLYFNSDLSLPVFPPRDGTVAKIYIDLGDSVQQNQPLYALEAGGKTEDVCSPIAGQVTSINAPVGMLVQAGKAPAPCAVAKVSTKWMLGSVSEIDAPSIHPNQPVEVKVEAYPGEIFKGKVSRIYATVDSNTHRVSIRCEVLDPHNKLLSGMLATFTVRVQSGIDSIAIPENGVVREGDGTLTAWSTTDRQHFVQRSIKVGLQRDGMEQVLEGLQQGESVVTDGAVFLSNMLNAPPSD